MSGLVVFPGGWPPLRPHPLTSREVEILERLFRGERSRDISEALGITMATLKTHRENIRTKLRVRTMTAAVYAAAKQGIVKL